MSSRRCAMRSRALEAALLALALAAGVAPASRAAEPPTRAALDAAAEQLRRDPRLIATKADKELKFDFDRGDTPPPKQEELPAWLRWLRDFVDWLNDTGRFLVWTLGAIAVALLAVRLHRLWRSHRGDDEPATAAALPTHVNALDIRPEALPADIGAAALALWREGRGAEAMSLLYRGALSALVHGHAVPIRSSSTEGDCLLLARPHLPAPAHAYFGVLVEAWRSQVYAARPPAEATVQRLCAEFGTRLAPPGGSAA